MDKWVVSVYYGFTGKKEIFTFNTKEEAEKDCQKRSKEFNEHGFFGITCTVERY